MAVWFCQGSVSLLVLLCWILSCRYRGCSRANKFDISSTFASRRPKQNKNASHIHPQSQFGFCSLYDRLQLEWEKYVKLFASFPHFFQLFFFFSLSRWFSRSLCALLSGVPPSFVCSAPFEVLPYQNRTAWMKTLGIIHTHNGTPVNHTITERWKYNPVSLHRVRTDSTILKPSPHVAISTAGSFTLIWVDSYLPGFNKCPKSQVHHSFFFTPSRLHVLFMRKSQYWLNEILIVYSGIL